MTYLLHAKLKNCLRSYTIKGRLVTSRVYLRVSAKAMQSIIGNIIPICTYPRRPSLSLHIIIMLPLSALLVIHAAAANSSDYPHHRTSRSGVSKSRRGGSHNLASRNHLLDLDETEEDPFGFQTPSDLKDLLENDDILSSSSRSGSDLEESVPSRTTRSSSTSMSSFDYESGVNSDPFMDIDFSEYDADSFDHLRTPESSSSPTSMTGNSSEKDALYDAYNLLHTLAQDFKKPFDAPAVLVVGHQSSGKSALIEALMGFQFNQVGGGTKTRRPIALRMQYNPRCTTPKCYLQCDDGVERPRSMLEIQQYIEAENKRLERDPMRCFDSREINVRMEYKYCPNMILIDTPGLIAAPKMNRNNQGSANAQQRALYASAREAEKLVIQKMQCQDYIILCVEDTADWKHGITREVVQKADPDLSRTVIVNTKFDTKVPQFGTPSDVESFLRADIIKQISPHSLGGPFFTSVPSGRVGSGQIYLFSSNDDFVEACINNEDADLSLITQRLKLGLGDHEIQKLLPKIGLTNLRHFLERKVDECYRRNVAKILPLLRSEHKNTSRKLAKIQEELDELSPERLKASADVFCDEFCKALKEAIHGSIKAPANIYGEKLEQEHTISGSFHELPTSPLAIGSDTYISLLDSEVGSTQHRLYGGAQYHRVMREFHLASKCMRLPIITEDEVANAAGVGETHDGVNFLRAACVISIFKAQSSFDPFLDTLRARCAHVMNKLVPVCEYMLRQKDLISSSPIADTKFKSHADVTQNPQFQQLVKSIFEDFVDKCSDSVMRRCKDDLHALTKFVTWDLRERSSGALRRSLPDSTDIVQVYQVALAASTGDETPQLTNNKKKEKEASSNRQVTERVAQPIETERDDRDYRNLLQLMEEAAMARDANRTNMVVGGLVQHIVSQWRESFGRQVVTKFNCFFLLPFVDDFQRYLRTELYRMSENELSDFYDMTKVRRQLQRQKEELLNELKANTRLQDKFEAVSSMMNLQQ